MAETFFLQALFSNTLSHAYILKGHSTSQQYQLTLDLAKALNCQNQPVSQQQATHLSDVYCNQCKECKWISSNAHPNVITVSRMTFQISDTATPEPLSIAEVEKIAKKSLWPKQIKTAQIGYLIKQLSIGHTKNRVVIFTDSEELPANHASCITAPYEWSCLESSQERSFHVRPITQQLFNNNSINRFLKTLEEPPANVLFFFLVAHENSLLETIISRCQVITLLKPEEKIAHLPSLNTEFKDFFNVFFKRLFTGADVYQLHQELAQFFIESHALSWLQVFDQFSLYWQQHLHSKPDSISFTTYRHLQHCIKEAHASITSKTHESASIINFLIRLQAQEKTEQDQHTFLSLEQANS